MKTTPLKLLSTLFYFWLMLLLVVSSCKKEGDGQLRPDEEEPPDEEVLSGTLTEDKTLYNRFTDPNQLDYRVPSSITISAELTIMPGVRIEMGPAAKMTVTSQGRLRIMGTPDSNIVITGKQHNPGYWDYIMIHSFDSVNEIKYTVIEDGGGNPNAEGTLILNSTSMVNMHNTTIQKSERNGMVVINPDSRLVNFQNNEIRESGYAPLVINSSQISSIAESNVFSNQNVYNYIKVVGSNVLTPQTWGKSDVPFYLMDATSIYADLIIAPGARYIFGPAGRILVKETGSLNAIGTDVDSIYFSGVQNISGYWDCILFLSNNPLNEFKYVSLKYGGGYWYWNASIYLQDAFFKISYSTIANSARWGIYRNGVYEFINGGFNNFSDNATGAIGP